MVFVPIYYVTKVKKNGGDYFMNLFFIDFYRFLRRI